MLLSRRYVESKIGLLITLANLCWRVAVYIKFIGFISYNRVSKPFFYFRKLTTKWGVNTLWYELHVKQFQRAVDFREYIFKIHTVSPTKRNLKTTSQISFVSTKKRYPKQAKWITWKLRSLENKIRIYISSPLNNSYINIPC